MLRNVVRLLTSGHILFILYFSLLALVNIYNAFPLDGHHPLFEVDFKKAYYAAGDALVHGGPQALWPLIEQAEFVNWPITAYLFVPFAWIGLQNAEWLFTVLGILAIVATFLLLSKDCPSGTRLMLALLFLGNGPLWYSLAGMGNTTHFILLALIISLLLLRSERMYGAGIIIGAAAAIKPMISIFILYFIYRRNYRAAFSSMAVIAFIAVFSVIVFGQTITHGWYEHCIVAFSKNPIGAFNNQSLSAFLLRLQTGEKYFHDWRGQDLSFDLHFIAQIAPILLIAITAYVGWKERLSLQSEHSSDTVAADIFDFSILTTFCIVTSPVSWTHYYLLLLLPWGFHITGRLPSDDRPLTSWMVWGSMVFGSLPVVNPISLPSPLEAIATRTIASIWFLGGMLFLFSLFRSGLYKSRAIPQPIPVDIAWFSGTVETLPLVSAANDDVLSPVTIADRTAESS